MNFLNQYNIYKYLVNQYLLCCQTGIVDFYLNIP